MQIYTCKHKYSFQYHFIRKITRNTDVNSSIRTEDITNVKTKIICEIFELSTCNPSMCMYIYPSVWGNLEKYCKTITTRSDLIISKSAIIYCWYFSIRPSFNEFEGKINLLWAISYSKFIYLRAFMANTTRIYMHDSRELTHFARRMINWCSLCTYRSPRFLS